MLQVQNNLMQFGITLLLRFYLNFALDFSLKMTMLLMFMSVICRAYAESFFILLQIWYKNVSCLHSLFVCIVFSS